MADIFVFPTIYKYDSKGKIREWTIHVSWTDSVKDFDYKVKPKEPANPDKIIGVFWATKGITDGKINNSDPTFIKTGLNVGKKNATNPWTQTIKRAKSVFTKKIHEGYVETINKKKLETIEKYHKNAANNYETVSGGPVFPGYVQRKIDGHNVICYKNGYYTRNLHDYKMKPHLIDPINKSLKWLKDNYKCDMYLDGELYEHGKNLQYIASESRDPEKGKNLDYIIFDVFCPSMLDVFPTEKRVNILDLLKDYLISENITKVYTIDSYHVESDSQVQKYFKQFIDEKYEGLMYKQADALYKTSKTTEPRTNTILKLKQHFDSEFTLIDYTTGKGRDLGAIIWIFDSGNSMHDTFSVALGTGSVPERKLIYQDAKKNFDTKYKGKKATIIYDKLSDLGIPQIPKFKSWREEF